MQKHGLNLTHDAIVTSSESGHPLQVILVEQGEEDWATSLNAYMVAEGLAILDMAIPEADVPEQVNAWKEFEDEAR